MALAETWLEFVSGSSAAAGMQRMLNRSTFSSAYIPVFSSGSPINPPAIPEASLDTLHVPSLPGCAVPPGNACASAATLDPGVYCCTFAVVNPSSVARPPENVSASHGLAVPDLTCRKTSDDALPTTVTVAFARLASTFCSAVCSAPASQPHEMAKNDGGAGS